MKKEIIKRVVVVVSVLLITACIGEIGIFVWIMRNEDTINKYLEEYNTGSATYEDVRAVNLHFKDYVKIGETENSDLVLSRSYWLFGITLMSRYKKVDRMGNAFVYKDSDDNSYVVVQTDDWCHFFRVYSVTKGVIKD